MYTFIYVCNDFLNEFSLWGCRLHTVVKNIFLFSRYVTLLYYIEVLYILIHLILLRMYFCIISYSYYILSHMGATIILTRDYRGNFLDESLSEFIVIILHGVTQCYLIVLTAYIRVFSYIKRNMKK